MAIKYFKLRAVGTVLAVNDSIKVGQGDNATALIAQFEKRPDYYIPCDKDGAPLSAKKESAKKADSKAEKE